MVSYMGTVTVILINILIAQMSTTYTQAKKVARLEYDVDRILQLTRMERFPLLVSKHSSLMKLQHYIIQHVPACVINAKGQRVYVLLGSVKIRKNRQGKEEPMNTCFPLQLRNVFNQSL